MTAHSSDDRRPEAPRIEELVRQHAKGAYRLAYRVLQNEQDAMDCVQDAFLRIVRGIGSWRGKGTVKAWTMRIVANGIMVAGWT